MTPGGLKILSQGQKWSSVLIQELERPEYLNTCIPRHTWVPDTVSRWIWLTCICIYRQALQQVCNSQDLTRIGVILSYSTVWCDQVRFFEHKFQPWIPSTTRMNTILQDPMWIWHRACHNSLCGTCHTGKPINMHTWCRSIQYMSNSHMIHHQVGTDGGEPFKWRETLKQSQCKSVFQI